MENILLTINVILAIILVILVLLQKSEGGALGIGVSQDNFMFSRTAGDFMTKATGFIAALFIKKFLRKNFKYKNSSVLYGGSVNPNNIKNLNEINQIDGFLIGGASQSSNKFIDIIKKTVN